MCKIHLQIKPREYTITVLLVCMKLAENVNLLQGGMVPTPPPAGQPTAAVWGEPPFGPWSPLPSSVH